LNTTGVDQSIVAEDYLEPFCHEKKKNSSWIFFCFSDICTDYRILQLCLSVVREVIDALHRVGKYANVFASVCFETKTVFLKGYTIV
jgi:hypothetical protein